MASNTKAGDKAKAHTSVKDLRPKDLKKVVGGKAGDDKNPYLTIKLKDAVVSNV